MADLYVRDQAEEYVETQLATVDAVVTSAKATYAAAMTELNTVISSLSNIADVTVPEFVTDTLAEVVFSGTAPVWTPPTIDSYDSPALDSYVSVPRIVGVSLPSAPDEILPVVDINFAEERYYSRLIDTFKDYLRNGLSGGTGIASAYEDAIYDRDRVRREREADRLILEVGASFATKGFSRPPGAYAAAVTQVSRDKTLALDDASRDVMVKRVELEQQFVALVAQAIPQIESITVDYHSKMQDRALLAEKETRSNAVVLWQGTLQRYTTLMEAARIESELSIAQVSAAVETNKGVASVNTLRLEESKVKYELSAAELDANVKVLQTNVELFRAEIDKYKVTYEAGVRKYEADVQGQVAEAEMNIKAADLSLQALINTKSILVEAAKANVSVSAQVLASALNSINTAISYGYSGNLSSNWHHDQTKTTPSGASTTNYHYFDETSA